MKVMFFEQVFDRDIWLNRPTVKLLLGDALDEIVTRMDFIGASGRMFEVLEEEMTKISGVPDISKKSISIIIKDRISRPERKIMFYTQLPVIHEIILKVVLSPINSRRRLILTLSKKEDYRDAIEYFNIKQFTLDR